MIREYTLFLAAEAPSMKPIFLVLSTVFLGAGGAAVWAQNAAADLRVESCVMPLSVENPAPRFSWRPTGEQTGYRLLVASSPELLEKGQGDLWDSGRVTSDNTLQIRYAGKALTSGQRAFWRVETWQADGTSQRTAPAQFSMGMLRPDNWKAQWITFPNDNSQQVIMS
jgi:alpha-L-rhamnosidase